MKTPEKKDLIFISTFITTEDICNLINSICLSNTNLKILLIIICQNEILLNINGKNNVEIKYLYSSSILSLSAARNIAIKYLIEQYIESDFIMFPDDDSTFEPTFFKQYPYLTKGENYIIDIHITGTNELFKRQRISQNKLLKSNKWSTACSVNMLISFETFLKVGYFDETLGVGTPYGAGEDNDYYIRACNVSKGFYYTKHLYNFHPSLSDLSSNYTTSQLIKRYNNYGKGVIACLCKHKMFYAALNVCLRAILGGIKNLLFLRMNYGIAYFCSSFYRFKTLIYFLSR